MSFEASVFLQLSDNNTLTVVSKQDRQVYFHGAIIYLSELTLFTGLEVITIRTCVCSVHCEWHVLFALLVGARSSP